VSSVTKMSRMFNDSSLSTGNYDNLLIGWSQLTLQQGVAFSAADTNYCNGADARYLIIGNFGWTITDGILAAGCELTITNANIQTAINACLSIDPVNGLCNESDYGGSMPTWDVSRVTDLSNAFKDKTEFKGDLSAWDVSNVTTMEGMFDNSGLSFENYDKLLVGWSQLTLQQGVIFDAGVSNYCKDGAARQGIIDNFAWIIRDSGQSCPVITDANFRTAINTCLTTNPADGLCSSSEYGAMPTWDVSTVTDMSNAFKDKTEFNADLSAWDVSNVTTMYRMFYKATSFNADLSDWDVSSVTTMSHMFYRATAFDADLSDWDVSSVTNMSYMFYEATAFNADLSSWDVSNVTTMEWMFYKATAFNGDLSDWDVSSVTNMGIMFSRATAFNADLSDWDVSSVTTMGSMFSQATAFNADLSDWDVSSVTNMRYMFNRAIAFNADLSAWDVSSVTDMYGMFDNSGLSRDNYDKLLNGWSQQNLQPNVSFSAVGINYCNGASGRQKLIDDFGWTITDGGLDCSNLSVEDENLLTISIYPNPVIDKLFIQGLSDATKVSIYNVLGKEVLSIKNTNNINVKALPKGVYIIRISDGVGQTNRRFIKN